MNHRCCRRRAVNIPASMASRNTPTQAVRITNISRGGAYVETACAPQIPIDSIIELKVKLTSQHNSEQASVQGMVIHRNGDGFGVMFVDEHARFIRKLCDNMLVDSPIIDRSLAPVLDCDKGIGASP